MLNKNVDSQSVLVVLLVDTQGLFIQAMLGCNPSNVTRIIVLKLIDVADDLALVSPDGGEKK